MWILATKIKKKIPNLIPYHEGDSVQPARKNVNNIVIARRESAVAIQVLLNGFPTDWRSGSDPGVASTRAPAVP
jgi:hypothetical protein